MTFPLSIFLFIYFAFIAIWALLSLMGISQVLRHGGFGIVGILALAVFVLGSYVILDYSYLFIGQIDWNTNIAVFQSMFDAGSYNKY